MERIKDAINRAKENRGQISTPVQRRPVHGDVAAAGGFSAGAHDVDMEGFEISNTSLKTLEANRIVNFTRGNPYSSAFDMLRTKIMQEMVANDWQTLLVTSPTAGCGKTVTAINLALSMARQPETQVCLIDLDLRKPRVASALGITPRATVLNAFDGNVPLSQCLFGIDIAGPKLGILGNTQAAAEPVEILLSRQLQEMLRTLKSAKPRPIIIFDMPPVLLSDDVLAFLPQVDCCILCVAEGLSTVKEIENSEKLLAGTNLLGCVLTKSTEKVQVYYGL